MRVVTDRGGRLCGTGEVQNGLYAVDVPATPGECTHRTPNEEAIFLAFVVNGERVLAHGRDIASPAYVAPASLAHAYRRDLMGRNAPADVFAADGCDGRTAGQARRYRQEPVGTTAPAAAGTQEPPCIELPAILQFDDRFVRRRVEDCFRQYESVKDSPTALPVRDVLESLHRLRPTGTDDPVITFVEDPTLGFDLGETAPRNERDTAAVRGGRPASARVRVLPALTISLFAALSSVNASWQNEAGVFDYCANVLHELVHALDYVTGLKPPDFVCDFGDGRSLGAPEVKSMTAENAYRISRNLRQRETYGSHRLPGHLVQPAMANWTRYQSHPENWAELCR